MFHLWETTLEDERASLSPLDQWICPGPHQPHQPRQPNTVASCFAACPIYLFIRPSSTHDSLLISPIKINPHLKISTLARQRGCNRGGDGLSQSPPSSFCLALADERSSVCWESALALTKWRGMKNDKHNLCLQSWDLNHTPPYFTAYRGLIGFVHLPSCVGLLTHSLTVEAVRI